MKNYFYNLNKKYLQTFKTKVLDGFNNEFIKTDESFLQHIFKEITSLFKHLGGRTTSKKDIPQKGQYPDKDKFNKLINSIEDDIDKLYTAQVLIEDDLNSLLKFNSNQRASTFESIVSSQQRIMQLYIKHKKDISGEVIIENNFQSTDNLSTDSKGVDIDEVRKVLTLASTVTENKPIDTDNVKIYFTGKKPSPSMSLYPNSDILEAGSHWKIPSKPAAHFIDIANPSAAKNYKKMMIDTPNVNTGVGWTEFEAVKTELIDRVRIPTRQSYLFNNGGRIGGDSFIPSFPSTFLSKGLPALKVEISKISKLNKDSELIHVNIGHSLQGINGYVKRPLVSEEETDQEEQYKLIIPFAINAKITNEIGINFSTPDTEIPKINWEKSVLFSNIGGIETSNSIIKPADPDSPSEDGYYVCKFNSYVIPARLELVLYYGGNGWKSIPFQMTHYMYSINKQFDLPYSGDQTISLSLGRQFDIFVDSEPNEKKERARALGVLKGIKS